METSRELDAVADDAPVGVTFVAFPGAETVEIIDPIERCWYTLTPSDPITPHEVDPDDFVFPTDTAIGIDTDSITLSAVHAIYVRNASGAMVAEAEQFADESFPHDEYILEICAPIKIYLEFESTLTVSSDMEQMHIELNPETEVCIGARSRHKSPAGTIVTTSDPVDVMTAISAFGSALKTTSPERSFPTLRGHPPTLELGDSLEIPPGITPPGTGISLVLPRDLGTIYAAAPLAYYLGAEIHPGRPARLETEDGFTYPLDTLHGLETEIERVLKQIFLLDCVTRVDGLYSVTLHERNVLQSRLDLDFADLYDVPIARRTETYLGVPFTDLEDQIPTWGLTAHVAPTPASAEMLPFLVDDLALIRTRSEKMVTQPEVQAAAVNDFVRSGSATRTSTPASVGPETFVQPEPTDSVGQAWVGDGMPMGASKAILEGFENRLDRDPTPGNIDITVVCNDPEMNDEGEAVDEVYGSRESLPFDVTIHRTLTQVELEEVLRTQTDFLHYIGHIDREGFECVDGKLDASHVDDVDVDSFLLNACESYDQGINLVKSGSIGGVVTLSEVINSGAVRIGRAFAQLLNSGFPLQAALDIAKDESVMGGLYNVVGDGRVTLTQPGSIPGLCEIETGGSDWSFAYTTYPTEHRDMGSMVIPYLGRNEKHFLVSHQITEIDPTREELFDFFALEDVPVKVDGVLHWSNAISESSF